MVRFNSATTVTAGAQSVARASEATAQPKFSEQVASLPHPTAGNITLVFPASLAR